MDHTRPAMGMNGDQISGRDVRMHNTHMIIFQHNGMVPGCCHKRVQRIWPRPRVDSGGLNSSSHIVYPDQL